MLTQAVLKEHLNYDPDTGLFTRAKDLGNGVKAGSPAGGLNSHGYVSVRVAGSTYRAHRLAWLFMYGVHPSGVVDHINQVRTDNRIANLRDVSQRLNSRNVKVTPKKVKSGFKGVVWNEQSNVWAASIVVNGNWVNLGKFATVKEAAIRRKGAEIYYGVVDPNNDFANVPENAPVGQIRAASNTGFKNVTTWVKRGRRIYVASVTHKGEGMRKCVSTLSEACFLAEKFRRELKPHLYHGTPESLARVAPKEKTELTHDELVYRFSYDPHTGFFSWRNPKHKRNVGKHAGTVCPLGYEHVSYGRWQYRSHRLAWFYFYGEWPKHHIDHKNGDRLDNRVCNLRDAPQSENMKNVKRSDRNTSGVTGVGWYKRTGMWTAEIGVGGKKVRLGTFKHKADAISARKQAEKDYGFSSR